MGKADMLAGHVTLPNDENTRESRLEGLTLFLLLVAVTGD